MVSPADDIPAGEGRKPNRLIGETSPYLLQHAYNPVDWYPWGEEALEQARQLDRPIFLSVGYSACHWCHVMERESFESPQIAALMNEHFINIKVDREERPDLDSIYMTAVQMLTGSGGWPMSVFLTPDLRPFYGGTYFPPTSLYGRPSFRDVLTQIAAHYHEHREKVEAAASSLTEHLRRMDERALEEGLPDLSSIEAAVDYAARSFDAEFGGFGAAPKFPRSIDLSLLLRCAALKRADGVVFQCEKTLEGMARGGMYDQIGGGFHRYSVDRKWLVPHFEKMLYDNALLVPAYLEAFQLTGKELYRRIAREVLEYVQKEMTSPEGGFYSSTDADSEGVEGKYFVWMPDEVRDVFGGEEGLGETAAAVFCAYYNITAQGNFEGGSSIPHVTRTVEEVAAERNIDAEAAAQFIARGREALYRARLKRVPPLRDEKIITAWNGLMATAFARGWQILEDERYRDAATGAVEFVFTHLFVDGALRRTYKDGRARYRGYLDDYAFVAAALVDLYEATFELDYLRKAEDLVGVLLRSFADPDGGGFYYTSDDHEELICRKKDELDNATPASGGVAALTLLRLERLTGKARYRGAAEGALRSARTLIDRAPMASGSMLLAVDFLLHPAVEVAVIGGSAAGDQDGMAGLLRAVHGRFLPRRVLAGSADSAVPPELAQAVPLLAAKRSSGARATAFVCQNYSCQAPTTDPAELDRQLSAASAPVTPCDD